MTQAVVPRRLHEDKRALIALVTFSQVVAPGKRDRESSPVKVRETNGRPSLNAENALHWVQYNELFDGNLG